MPLFKRPDGDLVENESPVRRILPYIMRGRNESIIFHEGVYEIGKTRAYLRTFNHEHEREQPATLFHYFLWSCAQALAERPGLNRFVSGGRLYQRRGMFISFAAKKEIADDAPLVTVKLPFFKGEPFSACARRIVGGIDDGRAGPARQVDKELALAMKVPGWLLSFIMWALRRLDGWNLMPGFMIESDPLYTSMFVANLGSVGLDRTHHHLYEVGTAAMFAVLGVPRKQLMPGRDGQATVKDVLEVRWSLDERVNDGLYCARGLALMKKIFENPDTYANAPALASAPAQAAAPASPSPAPSGAPALPPPPSGSRT